MLRQTIKLSAVALALGGVFAYAVLNRQLGAADLREIAPPIGDAVQQFLDARDAFDALDGLPDAYALPDVDLHIIGQRDADAGVDPSRV